MRLSPLLRRGLDLAVFGQPDGGELSGQFDVPAVHGERLAAVKIRSAAMMRSLSPFCSTTSTATCESGRTLPSASFYVEAGDGGDVGCALIGFDDADEGAFQRFALLRGGGRWPGGRGGVLVIVVGVDLGPGVKGIGHGAGRQIGVFQVDVPPACRSREYRQLPSRR